MKEQNEINSGSLSLREQMDKYYDWETFEDDLLPIIFDKCREELALAPESWDRVITVIKNPDTNKAEPQNILGPSDCFSLVAKFMGRIKAYYIELSNTEADMRNRRTILAYLMLLYGCMYMQKFRQLKYPHEHIEISAPLEELLSIGVFNEYLLGSAVEILMKDVRSDYTLKLHLLYLSL